MKRITTLLIVCCLWLLVAASTCFAQMYTVQDLGTFGGKWSSASGINASGQVVGAAAYPDDARYNPQYRAFRTAPNSPINPTTDDLGTLGGGDMSDALGINDYGQAIGWASGPNFLHAFRTAANAPINPATDDLGTLGGTSIALAINDLGQVAGYSWLRSDDNGPYHGFRTAPNSPINPATDDLGTLGGSTSEAIGINAFGQVVGESSDADMIFHPFRTGPNSPINPATDYLGGTGIAWGINAFGQVVGFAYFYEWSNIRAFRTAPNSPINPSTDDLGTLDPLNSVGLGSWARSINAFGQVVGESAMWNGPDRAFLYDGVMHDLNDLIPASSGWVISSANAINDKGQIAATGYRGDESHAVRLDPIYKAFAHQPINADGSSIFSAKRGVIPVKFTLTQYDAPYCNLPPATISTTRAAGETLASLDENIYATQADSGSNFRIDPTSCQYVYNLAARALGVGTYLVNISIDGIMVGHAFFALK